MLSLYIHLIYIKGQTITWCEAQQLSMKIEGSSRKFISLHGRISSPFICSPLFIPLWVVVFAAKAVWTLITFSRPTVIPVYNNRIGRN